MAESHELRADETAGLGFQGPPNPAGPAGPRPGAASGFTSLTDVDSTVLAYAQWLSELQSHANQAKYHQKAELEVLRESMSAQNSELNDFKRHCMGSMQQLQQQVSDLKLIVADLQRNVSDMKIQVSTMRSNVSEVKTNVSEIQAERDLGLGLDPFSEGSPGARSGARGACGACGSPSAAVGRVAPGSGLAEISKLYRIIREVQEQTLSKFGEMDEAMKILSRSNQQKDVQAQQNDWRRSQELLSQAISNVSGDLGDFQQHVSSSIQKSQQELLQLQEGRQLDAERLSRVELQVTALHQNVQANTNELILLKGPHPGPGGRPGHGPEGPSVSPQRRVQVPTPGQRLHPQSHSHLLNLLDEQEKIRQGVKRP